MSYDPKTEGVDQEIDAGLLLGIPLNSTIITSSGFLHSPAVSVLSGLPLMLYTSICTIIISHAAEILYSSTQTMDYYHRVTRPIFITVNLVLYTAQIIVWVMRTEESGSSVAAEVVDIVFFAQIAVLLGLSLTLAYYTFKVNSILSGVPIEFEKRNRMRLRLTR